MNDNTREQHGQYISYAGLFPLSGILDFTARGPRHSRVVFHSLMSAECHFCP